MKNKSTSIIMGLIIIAILSVVALLGYSLIIEFTNKNEETNKTSAININDDKDNVSDDEISKDNTEEKSLEVPKIKVNTNINSNTNSATSNNALEELANGSNSTDTTTAYDSVSINKYFYNQLDNASQIFYKAFESNKQNMKSGNYKLAFNNTFTDILSTSNGQEMLGDYYQSAIEAYMYDNPDVFYLSPNKMYLNIETTTRGSKKSYNVFISSGDNSNYFIEEFSSSAEVNSAISQLERIKSQILSNKTSDTYENIKMIHDYLINNVEYDDTVSRKNIYNIYGALVNKSSVCEGYAKAFKYLADGLGIENTLVIGTGVNTNGQRENHAWNYVKLRDKWYAVDCTWDDPIIIGNGYVGDNIKYKYFLKGSRTMNDNHFPSSTFTDGGKVFRYPNLSESDY
ncbi:MAG: hypothetical protein IJH76_00970 [Clostridia bacterium]|nr:hypothetical protein [Clostridia bacterium]